MKNEKIEELIDLAKNNRKYSEWTSELTIEECSKALLSEVHEVINAIDNNDLENLKEELGDVLHDTFLLIEICKEKYGFNHEDSINILIDKFKKRKPHVFQKEKIGLAEERKIWHEAKDIEKFEKSQKDIIPINEAIKTDKKKSYNELFINTDGGSRGNPGQAAIGIVIYDKTNNIIETFKEKIGVTTNNVAEYKAILKGLELAKKYTKKTINLSSDSEVVVRQIKGEYKISKDHLKELFDEVKLKEKEFESIKYNHVFREDKMQSKADALVNMALDGV